MYRRAILRFSMLRDKRFPFGYLTLFARKNSQNISAILVKLDCDVKQNKIIKITSILKDLELINPNWPHAIDGQKTLASIVYGLHQNACHNDVNMVVNFLLARNYDMWGGLSTTILKSYIEQKLWNKALLWFEDMKKLGKIKHLRVYNDVINSLAQHNLLKVAYHYFNEVQEEELLIKTSRIKSVKHDTLVQLIECVLRKKSKQTFIDISDDYMKTLDITTDTVVHGTIKYIQNWAEPVPSNLINIIGKSLTYENIYDVNFTSENNLKCLHCKTSLVTNSSFPDLCKNIVLYIRDDMIENGLHKDLGYLDQLLDNHGYFDLLIDAGNVLYYGSKGNKIFSPGRLKYLLSNIKHFCHQPKKIALVFPKSFHKQTMFKKLQFIEEFLKENILNFQFSKIVLKKTHDDLVLCYLAAKSELYLQEIGRPLTIVSNDNFLDHRFVAGKYQHEFFLWLHHRQKTLDFQGNVNMTKNIQPVVKGDNGNLHLISKDGIVCCIKEI